MMISWRHHIFNVIHEKSPAICDLYGCRFVPDTPCYGLPPLVNNPALTAAGQQVAGCISWSDQVGG
ncbi:MAG: hypothetical protein V8S95_07825 [Odoribacter sp.]